ncbi:hypothetical protein [Aeromonas veronii]|uniref:hypothetical protein n=1 Tax=Aeromonas veronii TaxID=654 RepID=UPI003D1A3F2A
MQQQHMNKSMQSEWDKKLQKQPRNKVGRPASLTAEQIAWASEQYQTGCYTLVQLAGALSVSSETVRLAIK